MIVEPFRQIMRCRYCGTFADPADVATGIAPDDCCWKGPEWELFDLIPSEPARREVQP